MYARVNEKALIGLTNPKQGKSRVLTSVKCKKEFDSTAKLSDAAFCYASFVMYTIWMVFSKQG